MLESSRICNKSESEASEVSDVSEGNSVCTVIEQRLAEHERNNNEKQEESHRCKDKLLGRERLIKEQESRIDEKEKE